MKKWHELAWNITVLVVCTVVIFYSIVRQAEETIKNREAIEENARAIKAILEYTKRHVNDKEPNR